MGCFSCEILAGIADLTAEDLKAMVKKTMKLLIMNGALRLR